MLEYIHKLTAQIDCAELDLMLLPLLLSVMLPLIIKATLNASAKIDFLVH